MKLLMCQCRQCRWGRKGYRIKHLRSAARSVTRSMLRQGDYERVPVAIKIGYTD